MYGPELLIRFLQTPGSDGWQYHSRSDRHSKVASWGVALDLMVASSLLRRHVADGKVVMGVNHPMTNFASTSKKVLDLVFARPEPGTVLGGSGKTFEDLAVRYNIPLNSDEQGALDSLPPLYVAPVAAVLIALEAKACMTAHVKALPRLHDELNSSHLCVHGAAKQALAIGYVQVNNSTKFVSPVLNGSLEPGTTPKTNAHRQPADTLRVIEKVKEIPRRSASSETGFDGLGVTVIDFENNGGPVELVSAPPAPQPGDPFHYSSMIMRMASEYDATFGNI